MKLKLSLLTLLMAFVVQFSFAQEKTITGTISDENGLPLPGVNIVIKGTTTGTQTDFDGKYSISATSGSVLVFSYVGYQTEERNVGDSANISLSMIPGEELEEVVVVAYGTQSKESLTGSVAEVKTEELAKVTSGNVAQGLVGKVAGVQVFNNNGMPGDAPIIRFRGIGSINASAAPLYVVDGVPFNGDIASINSQDIESMTFLKDAASAALYGNRGANGVIIVTTKKGREKKSTITVDSRAGFSTRAVPEYDIMTGQAEYYEAYWQALKNGYMYGSLGLDAQAAGSLASNNLISGSQGLGYNVYNVGNSQLVDPSTGQLNSSASLLYNDDDWSDYLFSDGFFTQTHISLSGGSENSTHFFSVGYERNDGYVVNSGLEKITTRLKLDTDVSETFTMGANIGYTHINQDYLDGYTGGSTYSSPFYWSRNIAPIYPVLLYDQEGNPVYGPNGQQMFDDGTGQGGQAVRPFGALQHPYATATNDVKVWDTNNLFASGYLDVNLFEGFKFKYVVTGELWERTDKSLDTPLYGDAAGEIGGRVDFQSSRTLSLTQQQLLTYNKLFGKHSLNLLLGHESLDRNSDYAYAQRTRLFLPDSPYVNQASFLQDGQGWGTSYALEGYFSSLKYNFDGKYYLEGNIRRDGSSRFHPDNRWGTFFGVGASWRVSQEAFMSNISWLDELKLKASYGEQGNDNLGRETPYLNVYSVTTTIEDPGSSIPFNLVELGNKEITWETMENFNAGFDISLFNRRLNIEAEYFNRKISDMLFYRPLPTSSGFASIPENIGDMENKGVELTLDATLVSKENFLLSVHGNATHYKNKILTLPDNGQDNNRIISGIYALQEGGGRYDYFMREYAGVNPATGAALWYTDDPNNEGQRILTENYGEASRYEIDKSAIPDLYGGFGLNMQILKNFDLGVEFAYQFGGYAYDGIWMGKMSASQGSNLHRDFNKTWTSDNTSATLPRSDVDDPNSYYATSTLGLIESDYLSLQNISLGYTLNREVSEKIGIGSLRFYGLVDNVHLWSKRKGYDPRLGGVTGGSDNKYSILRTISFGINVKF